MGGDQAQRHDLCCGQTAEAVQGVDAIEPADPGIRRRRIGQGRRHGLQQPASGLQGSDEVGIRQQPVGHQGFRRPQARQHGGKCLHLQLEGPDLPGGQLGRGHRRLTCTDGHGSQPVSPPGIQESVLGQGARRDDPDHIPTHHGLGTALAGLRRVLQLLADRDSEAGPDQLGQIGLRRVDRHAGHGDVLPRMLAAVGQGNAQRLRRLARIVEEQLVEVPHAEEDQCIGVALLHVEELLHHRGGTRGIQRWRGRNGLGHRRLSARPGGPRSGPT